MRVAVTGAAGQLGRVVVERLLARRDVEQVVAIDRAEVGLVDPRVRFEACDVRWPGLSWLFEGCDAVVHLAFVVVGYPPRDEVESVNVKGSRNVFEAAARAGVRAVVYASSVAAYGVVPGHPSVIDEGTTRVHQPGFAYAATKYEVEAQLDGFEVDHPDVAVARLRPGILLGRRMNHPLGDGLRRGVVAEIGAAPPLVWDEDVADAVLLALDRRARGAFNLVADEPETWSAMAPRVGLRVLRVPAVVRRTVAAGARLLERWRRPRFDPSWVEVSGVELRFSSARARDELGWRPTCARSIDVVSRCVREVGRAAS